MSASARRRRRRGSTSSATGTASRATCSCSATSRRLRLPAAESWLLQLGTNDPGTLEFVYRTGAAPWDTMLDLRADGRVNVPGALGFEQADLYLSGKNSWSSVTYNARHGAQGSPVDLPRPDE